jgi:tRNA G18 (ribose-2'-O)-methylase SpoU
LIVGNEITGIDPDLLKLCDEIFYIPMRGEKKSFNVAIAFGIVAYQLQQ